MSIDEIRTCLRNLKLKVTPVRIHIFCTLSEAKTPVSAADLLLRIKANKTTIYREIDKLLTNGLISEINLGDGVRRYEVVSNSHHHHLICTKCKSVTKIDINDDFSEAEKSIAKTKNFKIQAHRLEFLGICHRCS